MSVIISNDTDEMVDCDLLVAAAQYAIGYLNISSDVELSITLVSEDTIALLHEEWLDLPGPTDVMSFPIDEIRPGFRPDNTDLPAVLGEIVLCPRYAGQQAHEAGREENDEFVTLIVHGVLHLVGHDHYEPDERKIMFTLQDTIVHQFFSTILNDGS